MTTVREILHALYVAFRHGKAHYLNTRWHQSQRANRRPL